jgi:hypothetical protein
VLPDLEQLIAALDQESSRSLGLSLKILYHLKMLHLNFHRVSSMQDGNSLKGERFHKVPLTLMLPIHSFITETITLKLLCVGLKCDQSIL